MLSLQASFCADGVCMHLKSEHARERALAAERVSDMLSGKGEDPQCIPVAALDRLVRGYLQMLVVELCNACRTRASSCHTMQPATEGKLRKLLCDARALWGRATAVLRSGQMIAEAVRGALPPLVEALPADGLAPISSDLLALVSLLASSGTAPKKDMLALYAFCRQALLHGRPALHGECARIILACCKSFCSRNDIEHCRDAAALLLSLLGGDAIGLDAALYAVRSFNVLAACLAQADPVFVRTLLITHAFFSKAVRFKRPAIIEEVVALVCTLRTCISSSARGDPFQIATLLISDSLVAHFKLETRSPVRIVQTAKEDPIYAYMQALAHYCTVGPKGLLTGLPPHFDPLWAILLATTFFAHAPSLAEGAALPPPAVLSKLDSTCQSWLLVAASAMTFESRPMEEAMLSFALSAIGRPAVSDSAIYYLAEHVERKRTFVVSLAERIDGVVAISPNLVRLLSSNFANQHAERIWTSAAFDAYEATLDAIIIEGVRRGLVESRSFPAILQGLLPGLLTYLIYPLRPPTCHVSSATISKYRQAASNALRSLQLIIERYAAHLQAHLNGSLRGAEVTEEVAVLFFASLVPLVRSFAAHHHGAAGASTLDQPHTSLSKEEETLPHPILCAEWHWSICMPSIRSPSDWYALNAQGIIVALVDEIDGCCDGEEQVHQKLALLATIALHMEETNRGAGRDDELAAIAADCAAYVLGKLESGVPFDEDQRIGLLGRLMPLSSPSLWSCAEVLLSQLASSDDAILTLCGLIIQRPWSDAMPPTLHRAVRSVFERLAFGDGPIWRREVLLRIGFFLNTAPPFIPTITEVCLIDLAIDFFGSSSLALEEFTAAPVKVCNLPGLIRASFKRRQTSRAFLDSLGEMVCGADLLAVPDSLDELGDVLRACLPATRRSANAGWYLASRLDSANYGLFLRLLGRGEATTTLASPQYQQGEKQCFWAACTSAQSSYYDRIRAGAGSLSSSGDLLQSFPVIIAKALLDNALGNSVQSAEALRLLTNSLGKSSLDSAFRNSLPRIVAFVYYIGAEVACAQSIVEECIAHIARVVKLSSSQIHSSAYLHLLLGEVMDIATDDDCLIKHYSAIVTRIAPGLVDASAPSFIVEGAIRHARRCASELDYTASERDSFELVQQALSAATADAREQGLTGTAVASKNGPPRPLGLSPDGGEQGAAASDEILAILCGKTHDFASAPSTVPAYSMVLVYSMVALVNNGDMLSSERGGASDDRLAFMRFPPDCLQVSMSTNSIGRIELGPHEDAFVQFFVEIFNSSTSLTLASIARAAHQDRDFMQQCSRWIIVEFLMESMAVEARSATRALAGPALIARAFALPPSQHANSILLAIADALKHCSSRKIFFEWSLPLPLAEATALASFEHSSSVEDACKYLYLIEAFTVGEERQRRCCSIYAALSSTMYTDYLQSLSEEVHLQEMNAPHRTPDRIDKRIQESLLYNQLWDATDVPPTFDQASAEDGLYLKLRNVFFSPTSHVDSGLYEAPPPECLASGSAFQLVHLSLLCTLQTTSKSLGDEYSLCISKLEATAMNCWQAAKSTGSLDCKVAMITALASTARAVPTSKSLACLSQFSKADLLWRQGHDRQALQMYSRIIAPGAFDFSSLCPVIATRVLLKAARCLWQSRERPVNQIQNECLERLAQVAIPSEHTSKASHLLASFYDDQYQKMGASDVIQCKQSILKESQKELAALQGSTREKREPASPAAGKADVEKEIARLERACKQDANDLERIIDDQNEYALKAVVNYIGAIRHGEKYNLTVFRIISLWFSLDTQRRMSELFGPAAEPLPLHKFLPLTYQLVARAEERDGADPFQDSLQSLIYKMAVTHPYHSVYQLLALCSSPPPKGSNPLGGQALAVGSKRRLVNTLTAPERRSTAALNILSRVKVTSERLGRLIAETEKVCQAYNELATAQVPAETKVNSSIPFSSKWSIRRLGRADEDGGGHSGLAAVPTMTIPVVPSGRYEGKIVSIASFVKNQFRVIGGINMPKVVDCRGSDGAIYRQLVKGKDDVRQVRPLSSLVYCAQSAMYTPNLNARFPTDPPSKQ